VVLLANILHNKVPKIYTFTHKRVLSFRHTDGHRLTIRPKRRPVVDGEVVRFEFHTKYFAKSTVYRTVKFVLE